MDGPGSVEPLTEVAALSYPLKTSLVSGQLLGISHSPLMQVSRLLSLDLCECFVAFLFWLLHEAWVSYPVCLLCGLSAREPVRG